MLNLAWQRSCALHALARAKELFPESLLRVRASSAVSDVSGVHVGERRRRTKISVRQTIVPRQGVFIPHGPQKSHEESANGKHVTNTAPKHLPRGGSFAGEADNLQAAQHHSWRRSSENCEQGEILQVDDNERRDAHSSA